MQQAIYTCKRNSRKNYQGLTGRGRNYDLHSHMNFEDETVI